MRVAILETIVMPAGHEVEYLDGSEAVNAQGEKEKLFLEVGENYGE